MNHYRGMQAKPPELLPEPPPLQGAPGHGHRQRPGQAGAKLQERWPWTRGSEAQMPSSQHSAGPGPPSARPRAQQALLGPPTGLPSRRHERCFRRKRTGQVSTGPQHRGWAAPTWPWRGQACCCGEANGAPNTEVNKGFSHRHRSCPGEPAVSRLKGSKFCKPGHQASSTGAPRPVWAAPGARGAKTPILHYGAQAGHLSLP